MKREIKDNPLRESNIRRIRESLGITGEVWRRRQSEDFHILGQMLKS
jgi:hypothetical protein